MNNINKKPFCQLNMANAVSLLGLCPAIVLVLLSYVSPWRTKSAFRTLCFWGCIIFKYPVKSNILKISINWYQTILSNLIKLLFIKFN